MLSEQILSYYGTIISLSHLFHLLQQPAQWMCTFPSLLLSFHIFPTGLSSDDDAKIVWPWLAVAFASKNIGRMSEFEHYPHVSSCFQMLFVNEKWRRKMIVYQESILSQSACSRPCGSPALLYLSTRATPDKSLLGLLLLRCDRQNVENQWHRW